ncbi:hypothetical protein L6452_01198 [Arctium lappa]|uniref:Uncharacterized protein n=1 Tax=Arctium lappa TaxID=4217 RepID=A0ACB9FG76_ARCLA|nr:hypothetical protein L6452_01198 [Arctium lappa]
MIVCREGRVPIPTGPHQFQLTFQAMLLSPSHPKDFNITHTPRHRFLLTDKNPLSIFISFLPNGLIREIFKQIAS